MGNSIINLFSINNIISQVCPKISNKFGKSFYNMSFNEGNITNTLEITAKERIDFVEKNDQLSNSIIDIKNQDFIYRLNFENRKDLEEFEKIKRFKTR